MTCPDHSTISIMLFFAAAGLISLAYMAGVLVGVRRTANMLTALRRSVAEDGGRLMGDLQALTEAKTAVDEATKELDSVLAREFPIGSPVEWERPYRRIQYGTVLHHGYRDRLMVRNERTGRSYAICAYDILRADILRSAERA